MTTAITAPEVAVKHPEEEEWYEFSFRRVFGEDSGITIWQNGNIELTCTPLGLSMDLGNLIIEGQSLFVYIMGGVEIQDPNVPGKLLPYEVLCSVDSTKDGMTKYSRRSQIGRLKVTTK